MDCQWERQSKSGSVANQGRQMRDVLCDSAVVQKQPMELYRVTSISVQLCNNSAASLQLFLILGTLSSERP